MKQAIGLVYPNGDTEILKKEKLEELYGNNRQAKALIRSMFSPLFKKTVVSITKYKTFSEEEKKEYSNMFYLNGNKYFATDEHISQNNIKSKKIY